MDQSRNKFGYSLVANSYAVHDDRASELDIFANHAPASDNTTLDSGALADTGEALDQGVRRNLCFGVDGVRSSLRGGRVNCRLRRCGRPCRVGRS